jgi:hypothetical protein
MAHGTEDNSQARSRFIPDWSRSCQQLTSVTLQCTLMIRTFHHRGLKRLYERGDRSGIRPDLLDTVERILKVLDTAATPQALDVELIDYD